MATLRALPTAVAFPVLPEFPELPLVGSPSALWEPRELAGPVAPVLPESPLRALEPVPALEFAPPVAPLLEEPDVAPLLPDVPVEAVGAARTVEPPPLPPLALLEPLLLPPLLLVLVLEVVSASAAPEVELALPAVPARPSPFMAIPLALRPRSLAAISMALPVWLPIAAPEVLPFKPSEPPQLDFFCEEEVAMQVATEPIAIASPLVLPMGLLIGAAGVSEHSPPRATARAARPEPDLQAVVLLKLKRPARGLLEPSSSCSRAEAPSESLLDAFAALARRMPFEISV